MRLGCLRPSRDYATHNLEDLIYYRISIGRSLAPFLFAFVIKKVMSCPPLCGHPDPRSRYRASGMTIIVELS